MLVREKVFQMYMLIHIKPIFCLTSSCSHFAQVRVSPPSRSVVVNRNLNACSLRCLWLFGSCSRFSQSATSCFCVLHIYVFPRTSHAFYRGFIQRSKYVQKDIKLKETKPLNNEIIEFLKKKKKYNRYKIFRKYS